MLLYHFPLTSNSSTPNLENKGLKSDYTLKSGWTFEQEGKLSSYCARTNKKSMFIPVDGDFTLCFRVKSKIVQYSWARMVVFFNQQNESNFSILYSTPNHELNYGVYASTRNGVVKNIFEVDDNKWHDIIVTRSNGLIMCYVDSSYIKSSQDNGTSLITMFYLAVDPRQAWDCYLQDIRIYDYCLSQQEIKEYSKALVLHYPLNGSELGNVVKDCSGFGNDGEVKTISSGTAHYDIDTPRNKKSIELNNCGIICKDPISDNTDTFSISCWVKYIGSAFQIWCGRKESGKSYSLLVNTSKAIQFYDNTQKTTEYKITDTKWHLVTLTYNKNSNGKIYVDSDKKLEFTPSLYIGKSNILASLCTIMNNDVISQERSGCFSDFRLYMSELSEQDIKDLYNAPINFDKTTMNAIELSENVKYKSFAWRTPTYDEMNYIINTRPNASNLRGLGRVLFNDNSYIVGCFILPDDFVDPEGITFTPTIANFTINGYTLEQFRKLEDVGVVFFVSAGHRQSDVYSGGSIGAYWFDSCSRFWIATNQYFEIGKNSSFRYRGQSIRLAKSSPQGKFSTSATTKIDFAPANLQYHCTKHIWRFAEHQYDYIGATNANISDTYNGWIDLFGYGTSGKNFSPTLHTTNNADYASADISGTQNDWGVNEIVEPPYLDYDNKFHKTGIVKANEISEKLVYPSKYWRTPTYDEMNYILNTRTNASNLKGLGRINVNGTYIKGGFLLPDNFMSPEGITFTPTTANYTTNSYTLEQFRKLEEVGVVFLCQNGFRNDATVSFIDLPWYRLGNDNVDNSYLLDLNNKISLANSAPKYRGYSVRLIRNSSQGKFSTSATNKIEFAPANLQYHCLKKIWRFAPNQYESIGSANANISDTYDGWIDLFGYGTSGVNYSPTLHTTDNADYASGDISNTDNDWGVNEIENRETGFYKDKIRYNKIKEI